MTRCWIGVASRNHVKAAVAAGFCQFCHGREAPVRRLSEGDGVVYYSPREGMNAGVSIRAFTAIGRIDAGDTYRAQQSDCFQPWRRDVTYWPANDTEIAPLLDQLSFSAHGANWGWKMRTGFFEITPDDFGTVATAMGTGDWKSG